MRFRLRKPRDRSPKIHFILSPDGANTEPGKALKIEHDSDTTRYLLPPATAISHFVYQSEDYRGSRRYLL